MHALHNGNGRNVREKQRSGESLRNRWIRETEMKSSCLSRLQSWAETVRISSCKPNQSPVVNNLNSEQRRRNMACVTAKDAKPELVIRKLVDRRDYRFGLHVADLLGKPDVVLKRLRLVIFVNGCFWHQHRGCRKSNLPTTSQLFWSEKYSRNKERDRQNKRRLTSLGWTYLVIWECETRRIDRFTETLSRFLTEQEQHAKETDRH